MAGIFKTIGNTLNAVDTIAASGSRRLSVWATEQETRTKYRHVAAMTRIKTESAKELAAELKQYKEAIKDADIQQAVQMLEGLDKAEADAANKQ